MTSGLGARAATISFVTVAGLLLSGAAAAVPSASKYERPSPYTVPEAPPLCDAVACVHYVTTTDDAPPLTDANGNGVPDEPEAVLAALQQRVVGGVRDPGFRGAAAGPGRRRR